MFLAWIPAVLIAAWGYFYLRGLWNVILAPGAGVTFSLKTPGGPVTFVADSYSLSPRGGTVFLQQPRVLDPQGVELAGAKRVEVRGLDFIDLQKSLIKVRAWSGRAALKREPNGKFEFQRYLPTRHGPPVQIPFEVSVDRVDGRFTDLMGPTPWQKTALVTDVHATGMGDEWFGAAAFDLTGIGQGDLSVHSLPERGIEIALNTSGLELSDSIHHFLETPQGKVAGALRKVTVGRLRTEGPVAILIPKSGAFQVQTTVKAIADRVVWQGYAINHAQFAGTLSDGGAEGSVEASISGAAARFTGTATWDLRAKKPTLLAGGNLVASAASLASLPSEMRRRIPAKYASKLAVSNMGYAGSIAYLGGRDVRFAGDAKVGKLQYGTDRISNLAMSVRSDGNTVWGHVTRADYGKTKVRALGAYTLKSGGIEASVQADRIDPTPLLNRFARWNPTKQGRIVGVANAFALVSGTVSKPVAELRVSGKGAYTAPKEKVPYKFQNVTLLAEYRENVLTVLRTDAKSKYGALIADGRVNVDSKTLAFNVDARGLRLHQLFPDIHGLASVAGQVSGPLSNPRFVGQAEGYNLKQGTNSVDLVRANVVASLLGVRIENLQAVKGVSTVDGHLSLNLKSKAIGGQLESSGIDLGDLLGADFAGAVNVRTTSISGTISHPMAEIRALGSSLIAQSIPISAAFAFASLDGNAVRLTSLDASTLGGRIHASGSYDLQTKTGAVTGKADQVDLTQALDELKVDPRTKLSGRVSGEATASLDPNGLREAKATGSLANVTLNGTDVGQGIWSFDGNTHDFTANAQTSLGSKFLALENVKYSDVGDAISGEAIVSNLPIRDLYGSGIPYLGGLSPETMNFIAGVDGLVAVDALFSGTRNSPNVQVPNFSATSLAVQGIPFGSLTLSGDRTNETITLKDLLYQDGSARVDVKGTVAENGDTNLQGELANLDLKKLSLVTPGSPVLSGLANASFVATGPTKSPLVRASLDAESIGLTNGGVVFGLALDTINVRDGEATASGHLTYRGLVGTLTASAPLKYPLTFPQDEPVNATLAFADRPLKDVADFFTAIDPARSDGTIGGQLALSGPVASLKLDGAMHLNAKTLAFRIPQDITKNKYQNLDTSLKAVAANGNLHGTDFSLDLSATSSNGGSITSNITAKLDALAELLKNPNLDTDAFLDSSLAGQVQFQAFKVSERNQTFNSKATIDGSATVAGPLRSALIGGRLAFSDVRSSVPTLGAGGGTTSQLPIDPRFNVTFALSNPADLESALASIKLGGAGYLRGSLSSPDAAAEFTVNSGQLRLPGARVFLEPGGSIHGTYALDPTGLGNAHLQVALHGNTHVTSVQVTQTAERYDVHLDIIGDLLNPDLLSFSAYSSPPDLSQDQILALLGRTDILTALGANNTAGSAQQQVVNAFTGFALPNLIEPLTSRLAAALGLDYISVEYNALSQTSVSIGKTLGYGFSLQARQQISEPTPGFLRYYDYRLNYRLPFRTRLLRRVNFFIGKDQDNPWKIAVEYNVRF